MITQQELKNRLKYDRDTGVFTWLHSKKGITKGAIAGSDHNQGYVRIGLKGKCYLAHRLAFIYETGDCPEFVDHIDCDKKNNSFVNLRAATQTENKFNIGLKSNNKSGYKGVSWSKSNKKWVASINIKGGHVHLGSFSSRLDAAEAYKLKATETHGEFLRL